MRIQHKHNTTQHPFDTSTTTVFETVIGTNIFAIQCTFIHSFCIYCSKSIGWIEACLVVFFSFWFTVFRVCIENFVQIWILWNKKVLMKKKTEQLLCISNKSNRCCMSLCVYVCTKPQTKKKRNIFSTYCYSAT